MECSLLDLHFSQLVRAWNKSKHNVYSDNSKQAYHNNLKILFEKLKETNFCTLDDIGRINHNLFLDFFFRSIEFLDNSTQNLIPFEIVECLKIALKDWIPDSKNKFIIVTSFTNNMNGFSFDPSLATNENIYLSLKTIYGIEFKDRLIQINLPKYLARDYFACVVLYHELGHFVDSFYKITIAITDMIVKKYNSFNDLEKKELIYYFPFLNEPTKYSQRFYEFLYFHIGEYYSDIFASQYINFCSCHYLDYITRSSSLWNPSHPSTKNRNELVNLFLKNEDSFLISLLKEATLLITNNSLSLKSSPIALDDFISLIPTDISNSAELHSLFMAGWDLWLKGPEQFMKNNKMTFALKPGQLYQILNNLIEKSISNFVVKSDWANLKK